LLLCSGILLSNVAATCPAATTSMATGTCVGVVGVDNDNDDSILSCAWLLLLEVLVLLFDVDGRCFQGKSDGEAASNGGGPSNPLLDSSIPSRTAPYFQFAHISYFFQLKTLTPT
jgi:hypothetical protein